MTRRDWMDQGTKLFLGTVDRLADDAFADPTMLPGWSRAHVVAHVHYNALALQRLLYWAKTGERTPMYVDAEQRAAEIDSGAGRSPSELRTLVHRSAGDLSATIDGVPEAAWTHEVATAQGRTVLASEIVWMRTREVAVHAVDLDAGVGFADLPDDLNTVLAADVVKKRGAGGEAADLAAWLTGRAAKPPLLGPWL